MEISMSRLSPLSALIVISSLNASVNSVILDPNFTRIREEAPMDYVGHIIGWVRGNVKIDF